MAKKWKYIGIDSNGFSFVYMRKPQWRKNCSDYFAYTKDKDSPALVSSVLEIISTVFIPTAKPGDLYEIDYKNNCFWLVEEHDG